MELLLLVPWHAAQDLHSSCHMCFAGTLDALLLLPAAAHPQLLQLQMQQQLVKLML